MRKSELLKNNNNQVRSSEDIVTSTMLQRERDSAGPAEDAELLALLRGVSDQSGTSRFDDAAATDNDNNNNNNNTATAEPIPSSRKSPSQKGTSSRAEDTKLKKLPPWKRARKKQAQQQQTQVSVAAPLPEATSASDKMIEDAEPVPKYGIKSDMPLTFAGERGGAAEDAELLALLRGVSSKSGASRFDDDDGDHNAEKDGTAVHDVNNKIASPEQPVVKEKNPLDNIATGEKSRKNFGGGMIPPWKRGAKKKPQEEVEVIVTAPPPLESDSAPTAAEQDAAVPSYGIKSDMPSTFTGERGGSAEDAELLALLRGVSSKSGASRFYNDDTNPGPAVPDAAAVSPTALTPLSVSNASAEPSIIVASTEQPSNEPVVSRDNLADALTDKNWRVRSKAYEVLGSILKDAAESSNSLINADIVLDGLSDRIQNQHV